VGVNAPEQDLCLNVVFLLRMPVHEGTSTRPWSDEQTAAWGVELPKRHSHRK
jgi:hypothetical protein